MSDIFFQTFLALFGIVIGILSQLVQPRTQRGMLLVFGLLLFLSAGLWARFSLTTKESATTSVPSQANTISSDVLLLTPTEILVIDTSPTKSLQSIMAEYTVEDGDSLPIVSRNIFGKDNYAVAIGKANCTDILHTGDKLIMNYYIVQQGDYLYLIATRFGTSPTRLQEINGVGDKIYPNQIIVLPTYEQCK